MVLSNCIFSKMSPFIFFVPSFSCVRGPGLHWQYQWLAQLPLPLTTAYIAPSRQGWAHCHAITITTNKKQVLILMSSSQTLKVTSNLVHMCAYWLVLVSFLIKLCLISWLQLLLLLIMLFSVSWSWLAIMEWEAWVLFSVFRIDMLHYPLNSLGNKNSKMGHIFYKLFVTSLFYSVRYNCLQAPLKIYKQVFTCKKS